MRTLIAALAVLTGPLLLAGCVDAAVRDGRVALGRGAYPQAIKALSDAHARKVAPRAAVQRDLASAHRRQLLNDAQAGRCDAAGAHLKRAEALSAVVIADHLALLRCREAHGGDDAVREAELTALMAAGDSRAQVLHALLRLHMKAGRDAEAVKLLTPLEQRFALSASDREQLAEALVRLGSEARALQQLQRLKADDPMNPLLRLKIASLLEKTGAVAEAARVYDTLAIDYAKSPVVFLRIAAFHRRHGRADAAASAQARANALRGLTPDTRVLRPLRKSRR